MFIRQVGYIYGNMLSCLCCKASRLDIQIDADLSEADIKSRLLSKLDNSNKQLVIHLFVHK